MTVWKFPVSVCDRFDVPMPTGALLLDVQMQNDRPYLWALVNPKKGPELRRFRLAGTGHPVDERIKSYVGSFQMEGGALVFHLFELE